MLGGRDIEASNGELCGKRLGMHRAWGTSTEASGDQWGTSGDQWGTSVGGGALTTAGEAIPVQLIALVAATQEGPVGVEAALLTRSPHVTFVHIWGCQENGGGVKTKEQPSPHCTWADQKGSSPASHPSAQDPKPGPAQPHPHRSGCWAPAGSPAHTGSERSQASSRSGAGSSGTDTRLYLGCRQEKDSGGQNQVPPKPAGTPPHHPPSCLSLGGWAGPDGAGLTHYMHTALCLVTQAEVEGGGGETWGWVGMGVRRWGESQAMGTDLPTHSGPILR